MFDSAMRANRAAIEAFSPPADGSDEATPPAADAEDRIDPGEDLAEWTSEVHVDGEPTVGDTVRFSKTLSEDDVDRFAAASGDTNPLHLDEEWAEETRFEGRIVHGTLVAGLISAALARFPGNVVYLSQDLEFRAPVRIGDRVTAEVTIVEALGDDRYRLRTVVDGGDTRIIDGEAVVLIDSSA
ncbi:MaoC family dehydratase [Natronomonas marina]|jgi:acyl dehydratase|uniref:MaoC family dehydratase n=1 Tax=Natronomonas marina TaxID=2961939 RepID=UPI0020C9F3D7|nr:MaoC family dehydratase [Natronomonas marina]